MKSATQRKPHLYSAGGLIKKLIQQQNRIETIFDTQIILVCIKKLTLTLRMQEMKRYILTLTMLIITATVCAQNIFWLQGNWRGKAYLPGSDGSQYYLLVMSISEIKGNKFEGIIATMQPNDTTYRFDSKISGVVYDKYLIINRSRVLYVKDQPGIKWKVSCNNCKPPRMVFSVEKGKIFFRGEEKDCYKECNGVSEFSKDINEFDSLKKEAVFALVNYVEPSQPDTALLAKNNPPVSTNTIVEKNTQSISEQRIPVLPSADVVSTKHSMSLSSKEEIVALHKNFSLTIKENPLPRIVLTSAGDIAATTNHANINSLSQKETATLHKNSSLPINENPLPRIVLTPAGDIAATNHTNINSLSQKETVALRQNLSLTIKENPLPRIVLMPAGDVVAITNHSNINSLSQKEAVALHKNFSLTVKENPPPRIVLIPAGDIVARTDRTNINSLSQKEAVALHKNFSLMVKENPTPRIVLVPAGNIAATTDLSNINSLSQKQAVTLHKDFSLTIKENPQVRIAPLPAGEIVSTKHKTGLLVSAKFSQQLPPKNASLTIWQNNLIVARQSSTKDSITSIAKTKDTTQTRIVALPAGYTERKKNVIRTLTVNTDTVVLRVYDNGVVDGDIVSVVYNDNVVIDKLSLTTRAVEVKIPVNTSQINTLVFHAHNLGEFPPNTAKLEIIYGNKKEELTVSSDLTVSSTIDIVRQ